MGTGAFDAFDFGTLNLPHTYARLTYITRSTSPDHPREGEQLLHSYPVSRV
jgi:hypothetical protein